MDSINKNQEGDHRKDLTGEEAGKKFKEPMDAANTCFFCTRLRSNEPFIPRPMAPQKVDENGTAWFLSAVDSHKNAQIMEDPKVQLLFQGSDYSEFLTMYGTATITQDQAKIDELWDPSLKTWFTEGKEDPRITVIEVTPEDGYYWDVKNNEMVSFAKRMIGSLIGKTMDDSIEGKLTNPAS